jgi:phage terminase small subunit
MGSRGKLPGSTYGKQGGRKSGSERSSLALMPASVLKNEAPAPPAHLGHVAGVVWTAVHEHMPALQSTLDSHTVQRYCEAAEDGIRARGEIERHGLLLEEPIVTPRGILPALGSS